MFEVALRRKTVRQDTRTLTSTPRCRALEKEIIMTMQISIKNESSGRIGAIQIWENESLVRVEQLLPNEIKKEYLHDHKYVTVLECPKKK